MKEADTKAGMVIVGAGECGVRAAFALRENGYEGPVTLIGDERHLPYERPPLSKDHRVAAKHIAGAAAYAGAGIELLRGATVGRIDTNRGNVALDDGRMFSYDKLLIATGARARRFPEMEAALTLRSLDDAEAILATLAPATHIVVIGGGFIGLELAATARTMGAAVTVVETAGRLMARAVPADIAAVMENRHRIAGVDIILSAKVDRVTHQQVVLADGRALDCDLVVAGVGAVPNIALAEAAGLLTENGIVVDSTFRTSAPDVFAAGDCCCFPYRGRQLRLESWRAAQDQANHAARAMLGEGGAYRKEPWFWSDQYELSLQIAGMPSPDGVWHRRDLGAGAFILFQTGDDGKLVSASGIGTGNAVAKDIRLAEMMIERGIAPDAARLVDAAFNLKSFLKG